MRLATGTFAFLTTMWLASIVAMSALVPANSSELARVSGGDGCWNCANNKPSRFCKTGYLGDKNGCSFTTGKTSCTKYVFKNIDSAFCVPAATGAKGSSDCNAGTPMVCVEVYSCTDCDKATSKCGDCGDPGTEEKNTKCDQGAYDCKGK